MQVLEQVWSGSEQVNVSLTQFDQATHINNALSDQTAPTAGGSGAEGDPSVGDQPVRVPTRPTSVVATWRTIYDPEMQAWATEASATDDFELRKELYAKIMTRINELALLWYSGGTANMIAVAAGHQGHQHLDRARRSSSVPASRMLPLGGKRCSSPTVMPT